MDHLSYPKRMCFLARVLVFLLGTGNNMGMGTDTGLTSTPHRSKSTLPGTSQVFIQMLERNYRARVLEHSQALHGDKTSPRQLNKHEPGPGKLPSALSRLPRDEQIQTAREKTRTSLPVVGRRTKNRRRIKTTPLLRKKRGIRHSLPPLLPKRPQSPGEKSKDPAPVVPVSLACMVDRAVVSSALRSGKTWARKMADSSGHVGAGMLDQEMDFVGIREQCVSVVRRESGLRFRSQYCVASLRLRQGAPRPSFRVWGTVTGTSVGVCVPSTCNTRDVRGIVLGMLRPFPGLALQQVQCSREDESGGVGGLAAGVMTFLLLWGVLLLVCTAVHRGVTSRPRPVLQEILRGDQDQDTTARHRHYQRQMTSRRRHVHYQRDVERRGSGMVTIEFSNDVTTDPSRQPPRSLRVQQRGASSSSSSSSRRGILKGRSRDRDRVSLLRSASAATRGQELSRLWRLARCLSLEVSLQKLLDKTAPNEDQDISCLHGVRVLSLGWIVMSTSVIHHNAAFIRDSFRLFQQWRRHPLVFALLANGQLGMGSLFTVSGVSIGHAVSLSMDRGRGWGMDGLGWVRFLALRYVSVVPSLLVCAVLYLAVLPTALTGGPLTLPLAPADGGVEGSCLRQAWMAVLLVHNWSSCLAWAWYLAVDFQLVLLAPLLMPLVASRPRTACVVVAALVLACCVTSGVLTHLYRLPIANFLLPPDSLLDNITLPSSSSSLLPLHAKDDDDDGDHAFNMLYYHTPWAHAASFYPALLLGHLLYRCRCRASLTLRTRALCWLMAGITSATVLFGPAALMTWTADYDDHDHHHVRVSQTVYNALHGPAWSLSLCWMVVACSTGHGGPLQAFLGWGWWRPLSRLVLGVYLLYPTVLAAHGSALGRLPSSAAAGAGAGAVYVVLGVVVCSVLLSAVLSLAVQIPLAAFLPALFPCSPCCDVTTPLRRRRRPQTR